MKYSIGKKLIASGVAILLLIVFMIIASQIVAGLFKNTSEKLVIEYNELNALQEFKMRLSNLLIATSSYALNGNEKEEVYFDLLIHQSKEKLAICKGVLTESHDLFLLDKFASLIIDVDSLGRTMFKLKLPDDRQSINLFLKDISNRISDGIIDVDNLLRDTKDEIDDYIEINNTVIKHSTIFILSVGLIIALVILFGGWLLIKSITRPIKELVTITNLISSGDRTAKVKIDMIDEFHILTDSFNKMVDTLDKTTVSRNYLDNILKNMFDALLVVGNDLKIESANQAASDLLGHDKEQLHGMKLMRLLNGELNVNNLGVLGNEGIEKLKTSINEIQELKTKKGKTIPVLISCAIMKNQDDHSIGLIIVAHDLTESKAIEKKLDRSRKERLVEINEAQEEERMRIATDLHDGLGQMLTAVSYAIQELSAKNKSENIVLHDTVNMIQQQINKAIREAKNIAQNLIPIVLKDFGLIVAIENLISRANELYETKFKLEAFDFNVRIDPKREKVLYRICQESLNNIVKHAHAKNAYYQLYWQDCCVVLVIEDDGDGFDKNTLENNPKKSGIGLISMKERVLSFDGNFTINSEPGNGTEILVEIPCDKDFMNENS